MSVPTPSAVLGRRPLRKRVIDRVFQAFLIVSLGIGIAALVTLLGYVFSKGAGSFGPRLWNNYPSINPELSGARSALFGTLWVISITAMFALPVGIGAAIYLEEYADNSRWWNRLVEVNIQNLAAVPSIIYGILGLAFIVRGPLDLGFILAAGSLTLALLVLPMVIIASREALRAVPDSIRQGSLALGATQWQTIRTQVLPASIPGIATGVILAVSRALGETAPLLLVGATVFVTFDPTPFGTDGYSAMPVQIFNYALRPQDEFQTLAFAGVIVMLVVLLAMNSFAIWLRNRYEQRW